MRIREPDKLEELIQKLDDFSMEGLRILVDFWDEYDSSLKTKGTDLDKFEIEAIYNKNDVRATNWHSKVESKLREYLGASHFLYDISRGPKIEMNLSGRPTRLYELECDMEHQVFTLSNIIDRLEEREGLLIRKEIAQQEHDASTKYKLRYSTSRELTVNGILLARPDFLSENDEFLKFIFTYGNTWRSVPTSELLEYMKVDKLSKTIHQILSDLNITGLVKDIFMPNVSAKGLEFRNPISYGFAEDNKLPTIDLKPRRSSKK